MPRSRVWLFICRREIEVDITASAVYEHELAKHSDFQAGFESIIRNTAMLDRMLVSVETDYIIGGAVMPVAGGLAVRIGRVWGNGLSLELPAYSAAVSDPAPLSAPVSEDRIDTVQARAVLEEYDEQRRAFFNPETDSGQYFTTPTKKWLKIELAIVPGAEGREAAPDAEADWLKLAEILVSPGMAEVPAENIRSVTAIYQGEENAAWTSQKTRTFSFGSALELKTMLALEHTVSGEHRSKVIHAENIDFGSGGNPVSAKKMPLGGAHAIGTDEFVATDSVFESLMKEAGYRRSNAAALTLAIAIINETIADMVHEAPDDGAAYGRRNKTWVEVTGGGGGALGDAVEALKFFSEKTLTLTNARIADRRKRGWGIGLPCLSPASRVYHFDTDLNDQIQETNLEITADADDPVLAGAEDTNGQVYFNPAVLAVPPYETKGRSLYGHFPLKTRPRTFTETFTAEAWIRLCDTRPSIVLRAGSGMESVTVRIGARGAAESGYSAAEDDGIVYSAGEQPVEYSAAGEDGIAYSQSENDGIGYSAAEAPMEYSVAGTDPGNILTHEWLNGAETASLDDEGIALPLKTWLHIAAVSGQGKIAVYIGSKKIEFIKRSVSAGPFSLTLNPAKNEFNIDELLLDETAAALFETFKDNTQDRVPYAALDYRENWLVLEARDTDKVKTCLKQSRLERPFKW
jgi:hypothetical protein